MTVYRLGGRKARITLTDSEVRSFFGEYSNLREVTGEVRMTLALILEESLPDYGDATGDLIVEVRTRENSGCVITVTAAGKIRKSPASAVIFDFDSSEAMIKGILRLYSRKRAGIKSRLYKKPEGYRLVLLCPEKSDFFFMNEFCTAVGGGEAQAEYTDEHLKLLAAPDAIGKIGAAFFKAPN